MSSKKRACDVCGEKDLTLVRLRLLVNDRAFARWRLCRACAAVKFVAVATAHRPR